ncbi:MAG TPA: PH domain-containing protein [Frankiaceae bacterium]|nr:PH domain-containing protein [Frankiaceae bacterium]
MTAADAATDGTADADQHPSPRLWTARQTLLAVVAVPVLVAVGLLCGFLAPALVTAIVLVALVLVTTAIWVGLRGRYRSWSYREREDDLIVARGLLVRRLSVVPYGRMQFLDVTAGPIDRWFGLATVQLHTAAATSDARIPGLPLAEARRLRDRLAALGEARGAGL